MGYIASALNVEKRTKDPETHEIIITPQIVEEIPAPPIEALVLEGGGIRGIAYAGVVKILSVAGVLEGIKHIAGSSIGAISALLIALSYSAEEIEDLLKNLPLKEFLEGEKPWPITPSLIIKGKQYFSILNNEGHSLSSGRKLMAWLERCIEKKLGNKEATFADLANRAKVSKQFKLLYVTGSNFTKNRIDVFSHSDNPIMPLAIAVGISAAYPTVFKGIEYDAGQGVNLYLDGGIMNNLPSFIFNKRSFIQSIEGFNNSYDFNEAGGNPAVLNIKVDTREEIDQILWNKISDKTIRGIKQFSKALMYGMQSRDAEIYEQFSTNTIQVFDYDIGTLQFEITEAEKRTLVESGCEAAWQWLENHVSEAFDIRTYADEKAWLAAKSEKEIAEIRKIYQAMLEALTIENCPDKLLLDSLQEKISFLKAYLTYRCERLLDDNAEFKLAYTSHIDIKPNKPRFKLDEKIKANMKNMLMLIDKQIQTFDQKIEENKAKIEVCGINRLHDSCYDQVVYLAGFEEKNKEFKIEKKGILAKLSLGEKKYYQDTTLCSKEVTDLHVRVNAYKNKKTFFQAPHFGFVSMMEQHLSKREMVFYSKEGLKIILDLVTREDFKLYLLSCLLYLKFIKCNDHFIESITEAYQHIFATDSIPKTLEDLGILLKLESSSLLVSAYRIESLIKTFILLDKPKLQIDTKLINLDIIFASFIDLPLVPALRKKRKSPRDEEGGIELNYIYGSIMPHQDKFSIFERISFANSSFKYFKKHLNKVDGLDLDMEKMPQSIKRFFA